MKTLITDEKDERFIKLVRRTWTSGYYQSIGEELARYDQYNEFGNTPCSDFTYDFRQCRRSMCQL